MKNLVNLGAVIISLQKADPVKIHEDVIKSLKGTLICVDMLGGKRPSLDQIAKEIGEAYLKSVAKNEAKNFKNLN